MDNLTHSLVGLAAAKAGLERLSPRLTPFCILAANAPDSDIVVLLFGDRWSFLQHHRGITHSIVGTIALAVILPLIYYAGEIAWSRLKSTPRQMKLKGLLTASVIVTITHPLLDWMNNYGIRFFLPWNTRWSYGDLIFIVDPFMWLVLGGACFLLTAKSKPQKLFWGGLGIVLTLLIVAGPRSGAVSNPMTVRIIWTAAVLLLLILAWKHAAQRWGAQIVFVAFVLLGLYWSGLAYSHHLAFAKANDEAQRLSRAHGEGISKLAVMPTLANPFQWECVFETDQATYRFRLSVGSSLSSDVIRYSKPSLQESLVIKKAEEDKRTQIFLGFARFPVFRLQDPGCPIETLVQLADLRYTEPGSSRGTFALEVPVDCEELRETKAR